MTTKELQEEINGIKNNKPFPFWGFWIALISLLEGMFITYYSGYLISNSEPYLRFLPEKAIGVILLVAGTIKLIGILSENKYLKMIGIWVLSGVWLGLTIVAVTFSFGSGYPSHTYILHIFITGACFYVSRWGDYR